ncbi:MAG: GspH/FimT family pseudopilin [Thermodesulfobacteriota bacterium]
MKNRNGFTIMEMMVVIAITAIIMTIAIPNLVSWRNNQQFSRAVRQVFSDMQKARMSAISSNTFAFVQFDKDANTYVAWRDVPGGNPGALDPGTDVIIERGTMPPGVTIDSPLFSGTDTASFSPMGLGRSVGGALRFGSVVVKSQDGRQRRVVMDTAGRIKIES